MTSIFKDLRDDKTIETTDQEQVFTKTETLDVGKELSTLKKRIDDKDTFIERLQEENREMRKDIGSRMAIEELYEKLQASQDAKASERKGSNNERNEEPSSSATKQSPSVEDIASITRKIMMEETTKQKASRNLEETRSILTKAYGSNYVVELNKKVDELGLSRDFIDEVATRSPKALVSLLRLDTDDATRNRNLADTRNGAPPQGTRTKSLTESLKEGNRGKTFYDNVRRTNPKQYWSPAFQNEMHNTAIAMGSRFFET